jgi:hypothetical protein
MSDCPLSGTAMLAREHGLFIVGEPHVKTGGGNGRPSSR